MCSAVTDLLLLLDLEKIEDNLYRGTSPQVGWQRVFGGQVIGQALVAAARTVEERILHSMHAYFLLPGDPKVPIVYEVDRSRDGKSFTTRHVRALQHGRPIFTLSASFQIAEEGLDHQMPAPEAPLPESLPGDDILWKQELPNIPEPLRRYFKQERPIELRPVDFSRYLSRTPKAPHSNIWLRARASLPDDLAIHQCVLAYASDLTLLDASLIAHGRNVFEPSIQAASLDHAMWFHRPFRVDEWLLYCQDSPSSSGARGFSRGLIYDRQGRLVASVAQEGLIRRHDDA